MIREIYYFFRYGPSVRKRQKEMELVEFQKDLVRRTNTEGWDELRLSLVGDLEGDILEIGAGTGATFQYYNPNAKVTAIEPCDEFRAAAIETTHNVTAKIKVISAEGEYLPFKDASFDTVTASTVLCCVTSPTKTLEEFKRVLRPSGQIRLLEHVRSEQLLAGIMMDLLNPTWLRINKIGCNWNRRTVNEVKAAGFNIRSLKSHKIYSKAMPVAFPLRIIKAEYIK
jgi:ubiquinone/menaquinone biosynthesis C-methylase UbiE